jgi:uncharacterized protein (DUF433 family)
MATRYPLNLPSELKKEAAVLAKQQGVSLNQFFLWSISEKVSELKTTLDDPRYPHITYRRGTSGIPTSVIRGTGIRVQTIAISHFQWNETAEALAEDYSIPTEMVQNALDFYLAHKEEIDTMIRIEREIEQRHDKP